MKTIRSEPARVGWLGSLAEVMFVYEGGGWRGEAGLLHQAGLDWHLLAAGAGLYPDQARPLGLRRHRSHNTRGDRYYCDWSYRVLVIPRLGLGFYPFSPLKFAVAPGSLADLTAHWEAQAGPGGDGRPRLRLLADTRLLLFLFTLSQLWNAPGQICLSRSPTKSWSRENFNKVTCRFTELAIIS